MLSLRTITTLFALYLITVPCETGAQVTWYRNPITLSRKLPYRKPLVKYPPPPPALPTYDPSQENPDIPDPNAQTNNQIWQPPYTNPYPAPAPPPYQPPAQSSVNNYGPDTYWSSWTNLGAAFMFNPDVATYAQSDVVVAVNSKGTIKAKVLYGTSPAWVTVAPLPVVGGVTIYPTSSPAATITGNTLSVYVIMTDSNMYYATASVGFQSITTGTAFAKITSPAPTVFFQSNPTAMTFGGSTYGIAIGTDGAIYFSANGVAAAPLSAALQVFIMDPAAATYYGTSGQRFVVAAVGLKGDLYIYDYTTVIQGTFWQTDSGISCLDSPVAVSFGTHAEIYCRARDGNFYCITVTNGDVSDSRVLVNGDPPRAYKGSTQNNVVNIYSRTPSGNVVTEVFKDT